ncbi:glyoxalase superfamily protein [Bhargavaea cecembensis]|uniref:glyoxalase superfamily protein n=1 Tax=Bhargavaea cecembensis TaxID=394098 RepID=UPI00058C56EB|nr:glyoxalase superfamily protein [Bhargavaea cecembensis]
MVIPILRMFDPERTYAFYRDYLGFTIVWEHRFEEGMPLYAELSLDGNVIHLSEHHGDATPGSAVRIRLDDLEAFLGRLRKQDYPFMNPEIERVPWGTDELTVLDPSSNRIVFYEESRE